MKKIPKDFFEFRLIFIPININNKHWKLVVCDVESQSFFYCDSLNAHVWNEEVIENCKKLLMDLTQSINQRTDKFDNMKNCEFGKEKPLP